LRNEASSAKYYLQGVMQKLQDENTALLVQLSKADEKSAAGGANTSQIEQEKTALSPKIQSR